MLLAGSSDICRTNCWYLVLWDDGDEVNSGSDEQRGQSLKVRYFTGSGSFGGSIVAAPFRPEPLTLLMPINGPVIPVTLMF